MSSSTLSNAKLSLPSFLKMLSSAGLPVTKSMELVPKLYKSHSSPLELSQLTDLTLSNLGITKKEDRKLILLAVQKAGYIVKTKELTLQSSAPKKARKRKRDDDLDPSSSKSDPSEAPTLTIREVIDEKELEHRTVVVNRAPVMTAWSMIVSERIGFKHEEALSIASVYTEMNAISKGISLQIYEKGKGDNMEASTSSSQPYVEIMGRKIPLLSTRTGQWRALSKGQPIAPSVPFSYISRAFRQTAPYVLGAMRLLAESFDPKELNAKGFALYTEFRPESSGWGARAELKCQKILELRKLPRVGVAPAQTTDDVRPTIMQNGEVSQSDANPPAESGTSSSPQS